jgi:hypothetical protein
MPENPEKIAISVRYLQYLHRCQLPGTFRTQKTSSLNELRTRDKWVNPPRGRAARQREGTTDSKGRVVSFMVQRLRPRVEVTDR